MTVCDHDLARFDNNMWACLICFHVLSETEIFDWLDHSPRLAQTLHEATSRKENGA